MKTIIDNICLYFAHKIVDFLDWTLRVSRLDQIRIEWFIRGTSNIPNVITHTWNKKYVDTSNIIDFGVKCEVCNIKFPMALYCSEDLSLSCKEQQIKNLLE
jgi:hypothetical protein